MEMQLFILGHIILLGILISGVVASGEVDTVPSVLIAVFAFFVPLEIIYWILHWIFV